MDHRSALLLIYIYLFLIKKINVLSAVSGFVETNYTLLTDLYYKYKDKGCHYLLAMLFFGLLLCIVLVRSLNWESHVNVGVCK
jgi:hypothetical protein